MLLSCLLEPETSFVGFVSTNESAVREFQKLLLGHVQNLQKELANLISKLHLARAENSREFAEQVERTRRAISLVQDFFGAKHQSQLLVQLDSWISRLEHTPSDYALIRELIQAEPQVLRLAGGSSEGMILEDQIKNLVSDEHLKQELETLESKLREFILEREDELSFKTLTEIQRLAELIRQSQNRSILETICKTDALCAILAGLADNITNAHGAYTAVVGLGALALKVSGAARGKLHDKMLDYVDSLEIKMADLKSRLPRGGDMLAIQDDSSANLE